jgi:hypothetical protein
MDTHDYQRLRGRAYRNKGDNQKYQYLAMAYDDLRRRGLLRLIDYAEFYPESVQGQYLRQNDSLLNSTPSEVNRDAAVKAVEGWIGYARGPYQEPFRRTLGEDTDSFADLRQTEQRQRRMMKRGTGDTVSWNKKVLNKDVAALEVRRRADQALNLDVQYVIAGSEHKITGSFLNATRSHEGSELAIDVPSIGRNAIDADASHLKRLEADRRIAGLTPEMVSRTREILDTIGRIATEVAGVQHDDWFVLGPSLSLPRYDDLFDFSTIRSQVRHGMEPAELAMEAKQVMAVLQDESDSGLPSNKLRYEADWVADKYDIPPSSTRERGASSGLTDLVDYALDLSDHSRELRAILERGSVSQAAVFVGASIASDPMRRYHEEELYQQGVDLMQRLNPPSLDEKHLKAFQKERRGDTWDDHKDWFEASDRKASRPTPQVNRLPARPASGDR